MNQDWSKVYLDWNILGSGNDKRKLQKKIPKHLTWDVKVQQKLSFVTHLDELARISEVYLDKKYYFDQKIGALRVKIDVKQSGQKRNV